MRRALVRLVVVLVALGVTSTASADNGITKAGYGGEAAVQVTLVETQRPAAKTAGVTVAETTAVQTAGVESAVAAQSLPVTGVEIGALLAAGSILIIVGLGMRRLTRQRR